MIKTSKKGSILDLAGKWKMSEKEADKIKANLKKLKTRSTKNMFERKGVVNQE